MFEEWDVDIRTEPGDETILAEGKVDSLSFRYDRSMVSTTDAGYEVTGGNLLSGKKNPYLQTSEWGWQIGPVGPRVSRNEM